MKLNSKKRMVNVFRIVAVIVTLASIYLFAPWQYGLYYLKPVPDTVQAELDIFVEQGVDGVSIYVDRKGEPPSFFTSGVGNRIEKSEFSADSLFKIGSVAKLYDAAAITKLIGEGKITLNTTLTQALPTLAKRIENADTVTIRMLVQHRSGIPNYTDHERFHWGELDIDIIDLVLDQPADFEPDSEYSYSNSNYFLLQKIISRVTGSPHGEYIKNKLLAPLGLNQTYFSVSETNPNKLISGYHIGYEEDFRQLDQGYVSTAREVAIFLRALNEGTFFTEQEQEIYNSLYKYSHSGWVLGYQSKAMYHPEEDMVVIQFVNTTGDDLVLLTKILYDRVVKILTKQNQSKQPSK